MIKVKKKKKSYSPLVGMASNVVKVAFQGLPFSSRQ